MQELKAISVGIPVRIINAEQLDALMRCLHSVFSQSIRPLEVIISVDGDFQDLTNRLRDTYPTEDFHVLKNPNEPGIASNSNNALAHCKGDLVHILHQDDELLSKYCYEEILTKFETEGFKWLILEGKTKSGKSIEPTFDNYTKFGINRIGGPSGLISRRESYIPFNPKYSMLIDVVNYELYFRRYGIPSVLPTPWILYGELSSSASRNIPKKKVMQEIQMVLKEFEVADEEIHSFLKNPHLDLTYRKLVFDSLMLSERVHNPIFLLSYSARKVIMKLNCTPRNVRTVEMGSDGI